MRRTLKQQLADAEKSRGAYVEQLRIAEETLRKILKRRRFNRGQQEALRGLLKLIHVPGMVEWLNKVMFDVYAGAVEVELNRPALLIRNLRIPGKWKAKP